MEDLFGTWHLNSFELKNLTVKKSFYPYGENPIGTLILSSDGFMSVAIMGENRNSFADESIQMATEQEKIRAIESYLSYSGTWRIEGDKMYVNVLVSLLPNWINKEHFRLFQLTENKLTFQTPKITQGNFEVFIELSWKKEKACIPSTSISL